MQNNHFNEAYVKKQNLYVDEYELIQIRTFDKECYTIKYKENLFCPDCKQARLGLEFGDKIKCLRTLKGELHIDNCQHTPDVNIVNPKQIQEYLKTTSPLTIENNLLSLLSRLNFKQEDVSFNTKTSSFVSSFTFQYTEKKIKINVYIPQQKIGNRKNVFSYYIAQYYYGDIWLEIGKYSKEYDYVQLKIYSLQNMGKGGLICSVFVSKKNDNLSTMVDKLLNKTENGLYHIAFFGQMIMKNANDGKQYNNLYITDKHNIVIVKS
ncbi:hypothetical protein [Treponema sp. R80B11-R83G3]